MYAETARNLRIAQVAQIMEFPRLMNARLAPYHAKTQ